jgi:hypothetical protein
VAEVELSFMTYSGSVAVDAPANAVAGAKIASSNAAVPINALQ